mgnify:FL=1|jgi:hypothetical protein
MDGETGKEKSSKEKRDVILLTKQGGILFFNEI